MGCTTDNGFILDYTFFFGLSKRTGFHFQTSPIPGDGFIHPVYGIPAMDALSHIAWSDHQTYGSIPKAMPGQSERRRH